MKYKLKQWYPSLPDDWEVGDVVVKVLHNYLHVMRCESSKILNTKEVEGYPEFWCKLEETFTTEDGVKVYEGDKFYPVCVEEGTGFTTWEFIPQRWDSLPYYNTESFKYFSTKEAAEMYIIHHKPSLSIMDIVLLIPTLRVSEIDKLQKFVKEKYAIQ